MRGNRLKKTLVVRSIPALNEVDDIKRQLKDLIKFFYRKIFPVK